MAERNYERVTRMSTTRRCALCGEPFYLGNRRRQRDDGTWVHRHCEEAEGRNAADGEKGG